MVGQVVIHSLLNLVRQDVINYNGLSLTFRIKVKVLSNELTARRNILTMWNRVNFWFAYS